MITHTTHAPQSKTQALQEIEQLLADDCATVNQMIDQELASDVPLVQTIAKHLIESGGKRLRPLVVLLSAKAFGYHQDTQPHELATIIEFIHTATLLHDDVVDDSKRRRNQATANVIWGNQASVLVGDFLYSRAFQILARRDNIAVMRVLANTTAVIAQSEVLQLMHCRDANISMEHYYRVIRGKTAELFAAAARIGAMVAGADSQHQDALCDYGLNLGIAFQIVDDVLDYTADPEVLGKNIGDDLSEGKVTLPLLYLLHHGNTAERRLIQQTITQGSSEDILAVIQAIQGSDAIPFTLKQAKTYAELAQQALKTLPSSPYQVALHRLSVSVIERSY